jgi:hypothetical protein
MSIATTPTNSPLATSNSGARPDEAGPGTRDHIGRTVTFTMLSGPALAIAAIVANLVVAGAPRVTLVGSVAKALEEDLPAYARARLAAPRADPLDGAILLAGGRVEGLAASGGGAP